MNTSSDVLLISGGTGSFGQVTLDRFLRTDRFREIRTLLLPVWKQAVGFDLFARRVADAPSDPGVAR